ncbi:MAG: phosphatidylserine decarboxylase [Thiohalocapsa sp.]|jgi:phosphatidylserine decarboxylase precursor
MFGRDYHSKVLTQLAAVLLLMTAALPSLQAAEVAPAEQPIVTELRQLLDGYPDIAHALVTSLEQADWQGITTLDAYFGYLNEAVTRIPVADSLLQDAVEFYYLINQSEALRRSEPFQQWVIRFVEDWGSFLDTPASLAAIQSFYADPRYRMEDYFVSPGGWRNFNQFFAREVKPGKRPIAGGCDERIIVSPADSVFLGVWPVAEDATIEAKGVRYSIPALLDGSPYADAFRGGVFTHAFLNVNDYHRFHTPVAGKVLESRVILGKMVLEVARADTDALEPLDPVGYQFSQVRGLLVLESDSVGLVAVLPIGMAQVSSVTLTPDVGAELAKGEEFGFFQFGGSDIIMVFQPNRVRFTAEVDKHHLQGEQIGEVIEQ